MKATSSKSYPQKHNNGRRHHTATKQRAQAMRKDGFTHREISQKLNIAVGTAHLWTMNIKITSEQKQSIQIRRHQSIHHWSPTERLQLGRRLKPFQFRIQHDKKSLIAEIQAFFQKNGRIPLKQEFNSRRAFRMYFGSWNNAIIAAGFKPNPPYFAKRVTAIDGHICDSVSERIIDDWLFQQSINHQRNYPYKESKMTADFYLPSLDIYIEFFGLKGANKRYDACYYRKIKLINNLHLNIIRLYMENILKQNYRCNQQYY